MMKVKVLVEFADRADFYKRYGVGDEVSFVDSEYVRMLVERGIVEGVELQIPPNVKISPDVQIPANGGGVVNAPVYGGVDLSGPWKMVVRAVQGVDDLELLRLYLEMEKSGKERKARPSVVKAIEGRISFLATNGTNLHE